MTTTYTSGAGADIFYVAEQNNTINTSPVSFTNNHAAGAPYGISISNNGGVGMSIGTFTGCVCHSNTDGLSIAWCTSGTVGSCNFWRNNLYGVVCSALAQINSNVTFSSCNFYGNTSGGYYAAGLGANITLNSCVFDGSYAFVQPYGVFFSNNTTNSTYSACNLYLVGCTFGTNQHHTTGDLFFDPPSSFSYRNFVTVQTYDCLFSSPTKIANQTAIALNGYIGNSAYQQISGTTTNSGCFTKWQGEGTCINDCSVYRSSSPSERCTPNQTSTGGTSLGTLHSSNQSARVLSGNAYTVACYVRASISTDTGGAYTGNNPRLIERSNYNAGLSTDTVIVASIAPNSAVITTSATTSGQSPIVCNTTGAHNLTTGSFVTVSGATGDTAMNGNWQVTVTSTTQFSLNGSTSNGTYNASSASFGQWIYVSATTASVSDNTVLQFCIGCDGTTGFVNVDWAQNAGDKFWWNGEHSNFLTVSGAIASAS
jgi:hypothetical protein